MVKKINSRFSYTQLIAISFLLVIFVGGGLLSLPISTKVGESTTVLGAIFTATSATCVTGLVVYDTFTHWTLFGQLVILIMIQIGGLGFMTVITTFSLLTHRNIELHERRLLMESAGLMKLSGVVKLTRRVLIGTFIFEVIGAIALSFRFCPKMGILEGIYNAIFHSISAFCNAGFDLMGKYGKFSSLTNESFRFDPTINITIMLLIVIGGIGFLVWDDIVRKRFDHKHYELHTKIVLFTTFILIFLGAALFYLFERNNQLLGLNFFDKAVMSFFQSVAPRTAGFNTMDLNKLSDSGRILTNILMLIGGSPGSTAGGIKTTTFMVLILGVISSSRHTQNISIFKRSLDEHIVKRASAIFTIYISVVLVGVMSLCAIEDIDASKIFFEVISAIGTVGLSMGITSSLQTASKIILMILMYGGRVGGLTLMIVLAEKRTVAQISRPIEKIIIG